METLIIINFILTLALSAIVFLHIRHYRIFVRGVMRFAEQVASGSVHKKVLFVGLGIIAILAAIRKIFSGGSNDVSSQ